MVTASLRHGETAGALFWYQEIQLRTARIASCGNSSIYFQISSPPNLQQSTNIVPIVMQSLRRYQRQLCEIVIQLIQLQKRTKSIQNNFNNNNRRLAFIKVHNPRSCMTKSKVQTRSNCNAIASTIPCQRQLCEIVMQLIQLQKRTKSIQNNFNNISRRLAFISVHNPRNCMTKSKVQTRSNCNAIASTIPTAALRDRDTAYPASKTNKIHPEQLQLPQPTPCIYQCS